MWHVWGTRKVRTEFWKRRPEGKGLTGRPRPRWKDNISMSLQNVEWGGMDWVALAQGRGGDGSL
jgi:hypothetical protein